MSGLRVVHNLIHLRLRPKAALPHRAVYLYSVSVRGDLIPRMAFVKKIFKGKGKEGID